MTKLALIGLVAVLAQAAKSCEVPTPPSPSPGASSAPSPAPSTPGTTTTTTTSTTSTTTTLPPSPPPPSGCWTSCPAYPDLQCPCEGTVPAAWANVPPSRVAVGEIAAANQRAHNTKFSLTAHSKDVPPRVPHRGNRGESEQWIPTARSQDKRGYPPLVWYAAYPGSSCGLDSVSVHDCQIERSSRLCDGDEEAEDVRNRPEIPPEQARKECRRPNGWAFTDIVGQGGGVPGVRKVCALPPVIPVGRAIRQPFRYGDWSIRSVGGEVLFKRKPSLRRGAPVPRTASPSCHSWDFQRSGATLLE